MSAAAQEEDDSLDESPVTQSMLQSALAGLLEEQHKDSKIEDFRKDLKGTKDKIDSLADFIHEGELERQKRRKWMRGAIITLLTGGTLSFGGYEFVLKPPAEDTVEAGEVKTAVTDESKSLQLKVKANSAKVERLGVIAVEQQELTVESVDFIGRKIDAAHPRQAGDVEKPPALQEAETAVKDRKRKARAGELFKDIDEQLTAAENVSGTSTHRP